MSSPHPYPDLWPLSASISSQSEETTGSITNHTADDRFFHAESQRKIGNSEEP